MPQTLIESMARKKIVIASNNPATNDIIIDGFDGLIFNSNSAGVTWWQTLCACATENVLINTLNGS